MRVPDAVYVKNAFARIADRYVLANHVLSCGMDLWWRWLVTRIVRQSNPRNLLDVATGTGDLALDIQDACPDIDITATDFCPEMLAHASARGMRKTQVADALALPYPEASFDAVTVAFGLRNMADYPKALREMARVLRPGGQLIILDFSIPQNLLRSPYRWYLHNILPKIAGWITREKDAYEYLGASIEQFPQGESMCQLLKDNGFHSAEATPFTFGVVTCYVAQTASISAS